MPKNLFFSRVLLLLLAGFMWSCEPDEEDIGNEDEWAGAYQGLWEIRENTGPHSPQVYGITIERTGAPGGEIIIHGIYNSSENSLNAYAVEPGRLEVPFQIIDRDGELGISGEGFSNSDNSTVQWRWMVQERGQGSDSVRATMQR